MCSGNSVRGVWGSWGESMVVDVCNQGAPKLEILLSTTRGRVIIFLVTASLPLMAEVLRHLWVCLHKNWLWRNVFPQSLVPHRRQQAMRYSFCSGASCTSSMSPHRELDFIWVWHLGLEGEIEGKIFMVWMENHGKWSVCVVSSRQNGGDRCYVKPGWEAMNVERDVE